MSSVGRLLPAARRRIADGERARRTTLVMAIVERFVFDLGVLASGHTADIDEYVEPSIAARLRRAMQPGLHGRLTTRPDFGEYAQVRIDGDLLDSTAQVRTVVEFDDRSTRVDREGRAVLRCRRRVRLLLLLDPAITRILDQRLELA